MNFGVTSLSLCCPFILQIKLGEGRELPEGQGLLAFCPLAGVLMAGVGHTLHLIRSANIEQQVPYPLQYSALGRAAFRVFRAAFRFFYFKRMAGSSLDPFYAAKHQKDRIPISYSCLFIFASSTVNGWIWLRDAVTSETIEKDRTDQPHFWRELFKKQFELEDLDTVFLKEHTNHFCL
jgi:hypothetical protein